MTINAITGIRDHDGDIIATTLLNVIIMAANRRSGRQILSVADFNAFKIMLATADAIGAVKQVQQAAAPIADEAKSAEPVAQATGASLPPNML